MEKEKLTRQEMIDELVDFIKDTASLDGLYSFVEQFYEDMSNRDLEITYNQYFKTDTELDSQNVEYFTELEALHDIRNLLNDGVGVGYYDDLQNETFERCHYIIGTYKAKEALKQYDVFEAIEQVQQYELENYGELYTDLSNPEDLAHALYRVIGSKVLDDLENFYSLSGIINEEENKELIKEINELIDSLS